MSVVIYSRPIETPVTPDLVREMAREADGCFNLHRVDWRDSYLATARDRMVCWYQAPDAESARLALRQLGSDMNAVWSGELVEQGASEAEEASDGYAIAELVFDTPLSEAAFDELKDALSRLDAAQDMSFRRGFLRGTRDRMICIFRAADVEALQNALGTLEVKPASTWSCERVLPDPRPPA